MQKMTLSEIAKAENDLDTLRKLRQIVCDQIDHTSSGRDLAALSRQLLFIIGRIDAIKAADAAGDDEIEQIIRESRREHYAALQMGADDNGE